MRLVVEEESKIIGMCQDTLLYDDQIKKTCVTHREEDNNSKSMVTEEEHPLSSNGSNRLLLETSCSSGQRNNNNTVSSHDGGGVVICEAIITCCFWDRKREQQLNVVKRNTDDSSSDQNKSNNTIHKHQPPHPSMDSRKFNYDCPKVHPESQCQTKTISLASAAYEMLRRPFNAGQWQHLPSSLCKYQPRIELKSTVLSQSAVKLHFNLTFLLLLILLTVISPGKANPAASPVRHERSSGGGGGSTNPPKRFDSWEYLAHYGYVPMHYLETGALHLTEDKDKNIEAFQTFAQLPVTGRLDSATVAKLKQPRCGVRDNVKNEGRGHRHEHGSHSRSRRYTSGPSKWDKNDLTYRIKVFSPQLQQHHVTSSIRRAFTVWSRWVKLNFREIFSGHADIVILFARGNHYDGYPFDGPGLILAHAFFPGDDRGGDIHFDEDETWKIDSSGTDFFSVAVHEIGHALGLAHSSVPGSLMYPWYQGYDPDFELHRDDIEGIQMLYEARDGRPLPDDPRYTVPSNPGTKKPTVYIPPRNDPTPTPKAPIRPTPAPTPSTNQPPDPCTTTFDAITLYRNEIFMFKGKWFWRLGKEGITKDYPAKINRFFLGLPDDIEGFDAVYERPDQGTLVVFKGNRYWIFNGNKMDGTILKEGRPITDFGFPADVEKIDAAFIWGFNLKTYFISGDRYWKYIENDKRMAHNYPRDMSIWRGVKLPVDTAFKNINGTTFFFHKNRYFEYHDDKMDVRKGHKNLNADWLQCKRIVKDDGDERERTDRHGSGDAVESSGISMVFGRHHGTTTFTWVIGCLVLMLSRSYWCLLL